MVHIEEKENIVYTIAEGKLNDDDYDRILPVLRDKISAHGGVRWYFRMKNFEGWTFNAFWRDMQFDFKNESRLQKVAIVGESKWHEAMAEAMKPFTDAEIRYFNEEDDEGARSWIGA